MQTSKPYGDTLVEKVECVGHVQKRMGTRLRNLKAAWKKKTLTDGKLIGGKNRLTDTRIDQITTYYGNAIRGNKHHLEGMWKAIWAIYFHYRSTDKDATHSFFDKQWCKYLQAENKNKFKHVSSIPMAIMDVICPEFKALVNTQLLKKCLEGYTQNPNESLNSVIWKLCPKSKNHGLVVARTAALIASCVFNDGAIGYCAVLERLGLSVGQFTKEFCRAKDKTRIWYGRRKATEASLEYRREKRRQPMRSRMMVLTQQEPTHKIELISK